MAVTGTLLRQVCEDHSGVEGSFTRELSPSPSCWTRLKGLQSWVQRTFFPSHPVDAL